MLIICFILLFGILALKLRKLNLLKIYKFHFFFITQTQKYPISNQQNNSKEHFNMSITYENFNEVSSFDVIFIGHLASITANMFAMKTKNLYKSLVLKTQSSIVQPSLLPICTDEIKIHKKIKHTSVYRKETKIIHIKPISKQVQTDSGKMYDYKYLVYTGNINDWNDYDSIKTLNEALSNQYSLVYSNIKKRDISQISRKVSSGNVVFYIPNGKHSGYDNFNFLSIFQQIKDHIKTQQQTYTNPLTFKVILQGTSFFPYCQQADQLLKKQIQQIQIQLLFNSRLTKIDYLRRTLKINDSYELPYNMLYCIVPQKIPDVLKGAEINPYENNFRTLANKKHKSIFVFGADIFPTTHTFEAIQYQSRVVCNNLVHLLSLSDQTTCYDGYTLIPIYLNESEVVNVTHSYGLSTNVFDKQNQKSKVTNKCSWLAYLTAKMSQQYLTQSYYNYNSWGSPYYIFSPELKTIKLEQQQKVNYTEEAMKVSDRVNKAQDQEFQNKMNMTASKHKNLPRYSK